MNKKRGFTIVELLVVIAIIGVLAGVTIAVLKPAYFYGRGRDARRKSDLETMRAALEQFYLDNGRTYPAVTYSSLSSSLIDYVDSFPNDPLSPTQDYSYSYDATGQKCYELSATMETETSPYEVCGGSLSCQTSSSFCQ